MKTDQFNRIAATLAAMSCAALLVTACGGGGDSSSETGTAVGVEAGATANAFDSLIGSYSVACGGYIDAGGGHKTSTSQGTIAVADLVGADKANVSIHLLDYESPPGDTSAASCPANTLNIDLMVTGQIKDLGKTKTVLRSDGTEVIGKAVEFTYHSLTLTKGTLSVPLPTANATTQMVYVLDGNKLYIGKGKRDADGLASVLGQRAGVKQ